jgi:hypothetical protein
MLITHSGWKYYKYSITLHGVQSGKSGNSVPGTGHRRRSMHQPQRIAPMGVFDSWQLFSRPDLSVLHAIDKG